MDHSSLNSVSPIPGLPERVRIQLNSPIIYEGRDCEDIPHIKDDASGGVKITGTIPGGLIVEGQMFIPWSNIKCITGFKTFAEMRAEANANISRKDCINMVSHYNEILAKP